MPISLEEIRSPSWMKLEERYPFSGDKSDRYNETYPSESPDRYLGEEGREGGWKLPGYNPNHQSTRTERVNIRSDNFNYKPY